MGSLGDSRIMHDHDKCEGELTSWSTHKHLQGAQDHAVQRPGQAGNRAGPGSLQCEAQPVVPVLYSKQKCIGQQPAAPATNLFAE